MKCTCLGLSRLLFKVVCVRTVSSLNDRNCTGIPWHFEMVKPNVTYQDDADLLYLGYSQARREKNRVKCKGIHRTSHGPYHGVPWPEATIKWMYHDVSSKWLTIYTIQGDAGNGGLDSRDRALTWWIWYGDDQPKSKSLSKQSLNTLPSSGNPGTYLHHPNLP